MFRYAAAAFITCLLVIASSGVAPASEHPEIQTWLAAQTNLNTWSADLTQTRKLKTLAQPLTATGHVWFAAPNKFRWEIGSPAQTIAVRSGDIMQVIYPRLKRVERYPLTGDKLGQWKDTLALLEAGFPRSEADIEKQFKVLGVNHAGATTSIALEPRVAAARKMMPRITIDLATNAALSATELQFGDGSTMRNDFRNSRINPQLDPKLFDPVIDPAFTVVEPIKR